LVLEDRGDDVHCIAALPDGGCGRRWAARPFFQSIIRGRVLATDPHRKAEDEASIPPDLISPTQAALCFPIGIRDRCGVLVVLRPEGKDAFSADHLAIAKYCGVVALAALAARNSGKLEAEIERLQRLVGQMQRREHGALQTSQFLKEIVDHLPMSV